MSSRTPEPTATRSYPINPIRRETEPQGGWWSGLGPLGRKELVPVK